MLRPGGHLVLIWNRKDEGPKSVPWARDIEELLTKYQDDAPRYRCVCSDGSEGRLTHRTAGTVSGAARSWIRSSSSAP